MIQVSWTAVAGFFLFVAVVGPGFYWLGRTSKQVDVNTGDIRNIYEMVRETHSIVKRANGGHDTGG